SSCMGVSQGCLSVNGTFKGKPIATGSFVANFFFQAEDGIRDGHVIGVQTCALPISRSNDERHSSQMGTRLALVSTRSQIRQPERSEERRVGKSVDRGGRSTIKKKKHKTAGTAAAKRSSTAQASGRVRTAAISSSNKS